MFIKDYLKVSGLSVLMACTSLTCTFQSVPVPDHALRLWYNRPAGIWDEALPLGNGHIGAMVWGIPSKERIDLNDDAFWAGSPYDNNNPDHRNKFREIQRLIGEGRFREAQDLSNTVAYSTKAHGVPYQPTGQLYLDFPGHDHVENYYRELDLSTSIHTTTYAINGVNCKREMFISLTDDVMVIRISADARSSVSFAASFDSPQEHLVTADDSDLILSVKNPGARGVPGKLRASVRARFIPSGGEMSVTGSSVIVKHADEVIILLGSATNYVKYDDTSADEVALAKSTLQKASVKSFKALKSAHIEKYTSQFDRLGIDLGGSQASKLPTDVRVEQFSEGFDPQMIALYFQFGRYLLISSSQPGTQPANLQGIWNPHVEPPWGSKYTVNINTQMNYWLSEKGNLSELQMPLFEMVKDISQTGKETARKMYGANGWVLHHNTDLWRIAGPVDGYWGFSPDCGAWLTMNLFESYLYNGDQAYLRKLYPMLKSACVFFLETLWEHPETGELMVSPGASAENTPFGDSSGALFLFAGNTQSTVNVFTLFTNTIMAANALGVDTDFAELLADARKRLPPLKVGQHSQLQEWYEDWDRVDDHHRHVSHLIGLYPSNLISPFRNPELFEACKNSLEYRGDISTGWSMGWKVCLWSRLLDGNRVYSLLQDHISPLGEREGQSEHSGGTYPNLFCAHPPFQIDGNFGVAAGIAEMLLQSHDGAVHILPALPDILSSGHVRGLKARGGFEIDCAWDNGKIVQLKIKSNLGGNLRVRFAEGLVGGKLSGRLTKANGPNPNPFYKTIQITPPEISPLANFHGIDLPEMQEYDIPTKAGKEYYLIK